MIQTTIMAVGNYKVKKENVKKLTLFLAKTEFYKTKFNKTEFNKTKKIELGTRNKHK
jgi:hypothetical protein